MGEARNWDVFADLLRDGPLAFPAVPGFDILLAASDSRREAGYTSVAALLADAATTRFVLAVQAFVARRGWRNTLPGAELPRLTGQASDFAASCLDRLHRRVRKRGRKLRELLPRSGTRCGSRSRSCDMPPMRLPLLRRTCQRQALHACGGEAAGRAWQLQRHADDLRLAGQLDTSGDLVPPRP